MLEDGFRRSVGRPRQFTDEIVFAGIHHIITGEGYERLTVARLAEVVGRSGPAVIKRFTYRQGLLVAYVRWCTARTQQHLASLRADRSALDRLVASLLPAADTGEIAPDGMALPHLAGLVLDAHTDPLLQKALREYVGEVVIATQRLLDAAVAAGELKPVDTAQLTRRLLEAVSGAALLIELEVRSSGEAPARTLDAVVRDVLAPHRPYVGERGAGGPVR